jgi:hypothetical protein
MPSFFRRTAKASVNHSAGRTPPIHPSPGGPEPSLPIHVAQDHPHLALIHFALMPVILAAGSSAVRSGFFIRALIQDQITPLLQIRLTTDFRLDLVENRASRPRRSAHKMLQSLPIRLLYRATDPGKMTIFLHRQHPTQVIVCLGTGISSLRGKTSPKGFPMLAQIPRHRLGLFGRQPPSGGIVDIFLSSFISGLFYSTLWT